MNPVCQDPNLEIIGWHCMQDHMQVAEKEPNSWGLYDMSGNVWEWQQDWRSAYDEGPVTDPVTLSSEAVKASLARIAEIESWLPVVEVPIDNGVQKAAEPSRVLRGGSGKDYAVVLRSANRSSYDPYWSNGMLGFRMVRTLSGVE